MDGTALLRKRKGACMRVCVCVCVCFLAILEERWVRILAGSRVDNVDIYITITNFVSGSLA